MVLESLRKSDTIKLKYTEDLLSIHTLNEKYRDLAYFYTWNLFSFKKRDVWQSVLSFLHHAAQLFYLLSLQRN